MQPFGVNVLSVVTGAVASNGNTYFGDWKLPEESLFRPIEGVIAKRAQGHDGSWRMDREEYAEKVVSEIVRGASGQLWYGGQAGGVKFGETFMPQFWMVSVL